MEVITLNKASFSTKCNELCSRLDFQPDLVVVVLEGGGHVVNEITKTLNSKHVVFIKLKRKTRLKEYVLIGYLLKILPDKLLNKLRLYESLKAKKSIDSLNLDELSKQSLEYNLENIDLNKIKTILIVDDAIDTGKTMFVVKNNLGSVLPNAEIKTAIISWTLESSIVKPDYYLFKNVLVRFPWSKDYKGERF